MIRRLRKFWRSHEGASAVEFAMVMPLFLLMLFGIMEFGRLFWTSHALHETAIATARCMGIPQVECEDGSAYSASKTITFAQTKAAGWAVALDETSISLNNAASCYGLDGFSQVTLTYKFATLLPELLTSLAGGTDLTTQACYANQ
ncbi:TadE/TadG family type IV pilus assembly protein [Rhizobium hainanense]|uniref:TadE-like protein n=1 Tax=Rhizobium hainanense TaxID=52131 RepID=A0A1C3V946_9HYPH|nr:TadE/TadG family type IV pilus assembly protein [Rhizobium hainanense]SCB24179.1 TadE-like protein [Rhizobium hainanense]